MLKVLNEYNFETICPVLVNLPHWVISFLVHIFSNKLLTFLEDVNEIRFSPVHELHHPLKYIRSIMYNVMNK